MKNYKDFPLNMKRRAYAIYPRKGIVVIDGFRRFALKSLKQIDLNVRLSWPQELFVAVAGSKT
jgi:hypothetical protein